MGVSTPSPSPVCSSGRALRHRGGGTACACREPTPRRRSLRSGINKVGAIKGHGRSADDPNPFPVSQCRHTNPRSIVCVCLQRRCPIGRGDHTKIWGSDAPASALPPSITPLRSHLLKVPTLLAPRHRGSPRGDHPETLSSKEVFFLWGFCTSPETRAGKSAWENLLGGILKHRLFSVGWVGFFFPHPALISPSTPSPPGGGV